MSINQLMRTLLVSIPLLAVPTFAAPVLEEREGTGATIFLNTIIGLIKGSEPKPNICSQEIKISDGASYNFVLSQAANGQYVASCWANSTDTVLFGQPEADAAKCLTNLHFTQADTCIDVKGSECDNGYVANGGRLQNMRELIFGSGTQGDAQISADSSATIQAGIDAITGQQVQGTGTNGPYFFITDESATKLEGSFGAQMQINWIGEQDC